MTNTPTSPDATAKGTESAAPETPAATMLTTPAGETPKGEGQGAPPAPESKPADQEAVKYDLKLPEGSALDAKRVAELTEFAKANGLKPEVAQAVLDAEHTLVSQMNEQAEKETEKLVKDWEAEVKAKYGQETEKKLELARRALKRFDRSDGKLQQVLDEGYGNNPLLIDLLVAVGETMSDDTLVPPGGTPPSKEIKSTKEIFYAKP